MSVRMNEAEIEEFLSTHHTVTAITINPNGTPLPTPLWYLNKGSTVYIRTRRNTQKAKNLARDPRIVLQVEDGLKYLELRAVILRGRVQEVTDEAELEWWNVERAKKYAGMAVQMKAMPDAVQKHYAQDEVFYKIAPEKVRSWDNRKIRR